MRPIRVSPVAAALVLTAFPALAGQLPAESFLPPGGWNAWFSEWLAALDALCFAMLALLAAFACLEAELLSSLRLSRLIPEDLLEEVQGDLASGEFEKALAACEKSDSLIGRVFAAPLAKTDYPFQRMEQAMRGELGIQRAIWRQWLGRLELAQPCGIIVGAMGATLEAARFVSGLGGRPNAALALASSPELRMSLHCALTLLFLGLLASLSARIAAGVCSTRLDGVILEAERLGDELLDSFRPLPRTLE